jgi:hypothetical protein
VKFSVYFTKSAPDDAAAAVGYLFHQLSLKPGETRALGTTQGKAFPRN